MIAHQRRAGSGAGRFPQGLILLLLILALAGCGSAPGTGAAGADPAAAELTVFAAASLTEAFGEIGRQFEREHPGAQVRFSFAGSQQLLAQLQQGAPADVLAVASPQEMDAAEAAGLLVAGSRRVFAANSLVVIYHNGNPPPLRSLADLARPGLKVVVADPSVPVGHYTLAFLDAAGQDPALGAGFKQKVLDNVVSYEQSVKAVASKVALGEADAGIAYVSDARAETSRLGTVAIPPALNRHAVYPLALLAASSQPRLAAAFSAFVVSSQGQEIMEKHGFTAAQS